MDQPSTPQSLLEHLARKRGAGAALWCAVALLILLFFAPPLHAQTVIVETWLEDDAPVELSWSEELADGTVTEGNQRFAEVETAAPAPRRRAAIARYGPFRVVDARTVEMVGTVDSSTPAAFASMLRAYPQIAAIVMIDCPGSVDEAANLQLARAVRRAGLSTHVPADGSIRSGAVELWLAGVRRTADSGAEFGVHSWRDESGREARDYAADDPVHREYLDYYREMGLSDQSARRLYSLTNSVGFDDLRLLGVRDMAAFGLLSAHQSPAQGD